MERPSVLPPLFPAAPPPDSPPSDIDRLRTKIGVTSDALQRAMDALACDDPVNVNWWYVYEQLTRAEERVVEAIALIETIRGQDDDGDETDHEVHPHTLPNILLCRDADGGEIGGEA